MIVNISHQYIRFLKHYVYQTNFQYALKTNSISIDNILRDIADFKKRFLFSANCFFCIEFYLKQNHNHFFIKHYELLLQAHQSVFILLPKLLNNEITFKYI